LRKVFKQWRSHIFHVKIEQAKKRLSQKLFIVHPILRDALLEVRKEAVEISKNNLLVEIKEKNIELSYFVDNQKKWLQKIQNEILKNWEKRIRLVVEDATKKCLEEQGFEVDMDDYENDEGDDDNEDENKENNNSNEDKNDLDNDNDEKKEENNNEEKAKNGSKEDNDNNSSEDQEGKKDQKEKKQLTFTEQAARRTECRRLKRFVKLVDYITINTLHMLIIESTRLLLGYVFNGCSNDDVAFQSKISKNDNEEDNMYISNSGSGSIALINAINSNQQLNESDSQTVENIQIGGAVVGKEVKTTDLIKCGFQDFYSIMTELKRKSINIYMDLIEEYDDPISLKLYLEEQKQLENIEKKKGENEVDAMDIEQEKPKEEGKKRANNNEIALKSQNKPEILSIFHIELLLNTVAPERNLYFNPPLMDFINSYDSIIKLFISLIESFQLLSNTIPYLEDVYLFDNDDDEEEESDAFDGTSVVSIILDDIYFRELVGRIRGVFVGVFDNAFNWMKQWEDVRSMWVENESFEKIDVQKLLEMYKPPDFTVEDKKEDLLAAEEEEEEGGEGEEEEAEDEDKEKEGEHEKSNNNVDIDDENEVPKSKFVDFFEDSLKKYSQQLEEMEAIPLYTTINNVCIDTTNLKKELIPSPQRCFTEVSKILPNISKDKNESLLSQLQDWISTLNDQPKSVEQFVEYLGSLDFSKFIFFM